MEDWKIRLKKAREALEMTKSELALAVPVSNATATDWEKSVDAGGIKQLKGENLTRVCEVLGISAQWLLNGSEPERQPAEAPQHNIPRFSKKEVFELSPTARASYDVATMGERRTESNRSDAVELTVYDLSGSMGRGKAVPEYTDVIERITVSEKYLRRLVTFSSVSNLGLLPGYGDSMEPTFGDGDLLLVDRGVDEVKIDAVYVLSLNNELYIKRLQRRPDGSVLMISDNKNYDPYVIKDGELTNFRVEGRVLLAWNARKL